MRFSIRKSISSHSLFHNYLFAFLLGFGALLIVYLPAMCLEHGYFLYYGDYNSQQLPFAAAVSAGTGTPIWVQTSSGHMPFIS